MAASKSSDVLGLIRRRRRCRRADAHRKRVSANGLQHSRRPGKTVQSQVPAKIRSKSSLDIYRRLRKLQRLIPGGKNMKQIDVLFQETADYIMALKVQVQFLQALSNLCTSIASAPHQGSC